LKHARLDLLDRVARAAAGSAAEPPAAARGARRLSRRSFIKVAIAGAASASFGLPGRAFAESPPSRSECLAGCAKAHEAALDADLATCFRIFYGTTPHSAGNTIRLWARTFIFGGPELVRGSLTSTCAFGAAYVRKIDQLGCEANCEQTCTRQLRVLEGASSRRDDICSPTPPPKSPPPAVPPEPDPNSSTLPCKSDCEYCCPWGCADPAYIPSGPGADTSCDIWKRNCLGNCH
jgi:hypothetical protein